MGIDIYAKWYGMSEKEEQAQIAGCFSTVHGHVGYLREAYHGEPYATLVLVPEEVFERGEAFIRAAVLRERLPEALRTAERRERALYQSSAADIAEVLQSYRDFVDLGARKEAETRRRAASSRATDLASETRSRKRPGFGGRPRGRAISPHATNRRAVGGACLAARAADCLSHGTAPAHPTVRPPADSLRCTLIRFLARCRALHYHSVHMGGGRSVHGYAI